MFSKHPMLPVHPLLALLALLPKRLQLPLLP